MNVAKKVLYVGTVWPGSTCLARMQAMQTLGVSVTPFDTTGYVKNSAWLLRQLLARLSVGPALSQLNADLLTAARGSRFDYIWIDKGVWIHPDTLRILKQTDAKLVHYTPDPQVLFQREKLRHFLNAIPIYDVLFTTKPFELAAYRRLGATNVRLVYQSYDDERLRPRLVNDHDLRKLASDVCFIGQYEQERIALLQMVMRTGARLRFWGPNWSRRLRKKTWTSDTFSGDGVWGDDYASALNATKIALCFLSKRIPETTTTRTFEIPGCGTFMLAERTDDHLSLFEEGREAEFFADGEELVEKVAFYLANESARTKIAAAGHARCIKSGYGDRARMRSLLKTVDSITRSSALAQSS